MKHVWLKFFLIFFIFLVDNASANVSDQEITLTHEVKENEKQENSNDFSSEQQGENLRTKLINVSLALMFVIVLIYFFFYLARKTPAFKGMLNQPIRIVNSTSLGGKSKLVLIEVCGSVLLVGMTESTISLLKELSEDQINNIKNVYHLSDFVMKKVSRQDQMTFEKAMSESGVSLSNSEDKKNEI